MPKRRDSEEESEAIEEAPEDATDFYWKQSRENLLTDAGLRMFDLAYRHKDEEFEAARAAIDEEYERLSPRLQRKGRGALRKGGSFINYIALLQELGLMYTEEVQGKTYLRSTKAGDQAAVLLNSAPDPLRTIPYFLVELLSRYPLNNPQNHPPRNPTLTAHIKESDIFPYWTIFRVMRSLDNSVTKDELARFVFKLKRMADIPATIKQIKQYRKDLLGGLSGAELDAKYGAPLEGAIAQPKYIMGRAGYQTGVITLDKDTYTISPEYLDFVDQVLSQQPKFEELREDSWVKEYGDPVEATEEIYVPFVSESEQPEESSLGDDDAVLREVNELLVDDGYSGVILVGPPGTGKTWYARQIALRLVAGDRKRIQEVQFHQSYQYEDFVEGMVSDGRGNFIIENRHLLIMCRRALNNGEPHVLVIDELSRTDPARVMGEALTYMETSLRGKRFFLPSGRAAVIPPNLTFIATMNPEDRSVDEIDSAMDRRWAKVFLEPNRSVLDKFLVANGFTGPQRGAILKFFEGVQADYPLGHAFFRAVRGVEGLKRLWTHQLRFLFDKAFRYDKATRDRIAGDWKSMIASLEQPLPEATSDSNPSEPPAAT